MSCVDLLLKKKKIKGNNLMLIQHISFVCIIISIQIIIFWVYIFIGITKELQNVVNTLADSDGASEESAEPADTENECSHLPSLNRVHRGSLTKKTSKHQASHPLYQRDNSNLDTPKVAALEVQNVKRAINRYGTLPKGARIGAYLESLRHGNGESAKETNTTKPPANNRMNVPLRRPFQQPGNMTRSNSSTNFQPSSPRTLRSQPPPPNLADLEFPPPPPPEDLDHEEMSTFRFGVSLRHREPSTDSCNSAKSEPVRLKCVRRDKLLTENHQNKATIEPSPVMPKKNVAVEVSPSSDEDCTTRNVKSLVPDIMKEMMELKQNSASAGDKKPASASSCKEDQLQRPTSPVDFKTSLRKIVSKDDRDSENHHFQQTQQQQQMQRIDTNIAEIKSQLKKVKIDDKKDNSSENNVVAVESSDGDGGDDKRRSTGSINSLKKLWEGESPPLDGVTAAMSTLATAKERRVWPPPHDDCRPAVPMKPSAAAKSSAAVAVAVANKSNAIYATPGSTDPPNIIEQWQTVDNSLRALRSVPTVSSASWLSLSDKICGFHASCLNHADISAPPNLRFHLRELLNKLESQSQQMRSAGGVRQQTDHLTIFQTLDTTLKDILNVIQR